MDIWKIDRIFFLKDLSIKNLSFTVVLGSIGVLGFVGSFDSVDIFGFVVAFCFVTFVGFAAFTGVEFEALGSGISSKFETFDCYKIETIMTK